jgi:hypothetical protein
VSSPWPTVSAKRAVPAEGPPSLRSPERFALRVGPSPRRPGSRPQPPHVPAPRLASAGTGLEGDINELREAELVGKPFKGGWGAGQ